MEVKKMDLYLVEIDIPGIGMHGWTTWSKPALVVVEADSPETAKKKVEVFLPPEDSAVKKALLKQDGKKEYFDIRVSVLKNEGGVYLVKPAS
jgi:hypothetical protein